MPIIGRGSGWALLGAGYGVYKARHKLRTGEATPPLSIPKWAGKAALGIFLIGISGRCGFARISGLQQETH